MWKALSKNYRSLIVLITILVLPVSTFAKNGKRFEPNQCADRQEKIVHWSEDKSRKEIIVFDDLHREKYRISTETGRVFCGLQIQVEDLDLELDGD